MAVRRHYSDGQNDTRTGIIIEADAVVANWQVRRLDALTKSKTRSKTRPMPPRKGTKRTTTTKPAESYKHSEATSPMRPEVGTQTRFRKRLPPAKFRYDDSLAPSMEWDGQNAARDKGEWLLTLIDEAAALPAPHSFVPARELRDGEGGVVAMVTGLRDAVAQLKAIGKPFLNWSGKAERTSFDVPSLPLFIHERLSTKAILETLKGHKRDKQTDMFDLFGDPQHSGTDQVLRAYEHRDQWVNRMILGDSLVVMNSLLTYEQMGGQVQMIYMDPPYGVNYSSNFQPFVRKRNVDDTSDEDLTREPEMVQAYRDTWELGLHSYLTYLRDRITIARSLLSETGSIFVQIGDENLHHVRELLDEVFGSENFVAVINFKTMMPLESGNIESVFDYLCWYAADKPRMKYRNLYVPKQVGGDSEFVYADSEDADYRRLSKEEIQHFAETSKDNRIFKRSDLASSGYTPSCTFPISFEGRTFTTKSGKSWRTTPAGIETLKTANRLFCLGDKLYYKMYVRDFGLSSLVNSWQDTIEFGSRAYVVQTTPTVIQRCMLMTTDPGDLVLDPTCGSGTTAYVAEQWGRRWLTCDTSRVPLALARQRLLTATFPWYKLKSDAKGPGSGFEYLRRQNRKGEEVGGIVPHITLYSIANNEPPEEEVLVDRPEEDKTVTRITGAFCFEATIPTPMEWDEEIKDENGIDSVNEGTFQDRMVEVLRRSPVLRLERNRTVTLKNVRPIAKTLSLSAEALVDATAEGQTATIADAVREAEEKSGLALPLSSRPVAFVFGSENGAVNIRLVEEAAREAYQKSYTHLYVIGFAIQPNAREAIEVCEEVSGIPATYVQATPDLMMGDLLKNMRSSQIFSVCGLPEIKVSNAPHKQGEANGMKQVELLGLDVFDPTTMEVSHRAGDDVPAWFLDADYNGMCFRVSQAFFPRTKDWDKLKKALKGEFDDSVWEHLAGTVSAPFVPGENNSIAVKVIDDRGNELLVVKMLGAGR
jgi:adenine-specific DNA-methyltransferase